jgi:Spy/CpxP family protein refolding chaperone
MLTKTRIVIAAALVLASTSASLAATAGRSAPVTPGWSNGATGFVPGSKAEQDWFERASRPSNL